MSERFIRICPNHRHPLKLFGCGVGQYLWCIGVGGEGHKVCEWAVMDREARDIVEFGDTHELVEALVRGTDEEGE